MKEEFVVVGRKKNYHSIPELRKLLKDYDNPFFNEVRNFLKEHDIDDFSIEICILMLLDFLLNGYYLDEITYRDMWDWVEWHYDLNGRDFNRNAIEILPGFLRGLFEDEGFYIRYNVGTEITTMTSGYIPFTSSKEIKVKDVKSYKITSREIIITCWDGRCISKKINPIMNFHLIGILIGGKSYYQRSNTAIYDGKNYVDYFDFSFNGYCGTKCNELFKNRVLNNRNIMFVYYDWLSNYIDHDFKKSGSSKISASTPKGKNKSFVIGIVNDLISSGKFSSGTLLGDLCDINYCMKNKFYIAPCTFLIKTSDVVAKDSGRYYPEIFTINGVDYRVCSQWTQTRNIPILQDWYDKIK